MRWSSKHNIVTMVMQNECVQCNTYHSYILFLQAFMGWAGPIVRTLFTHISYIFNFVGFIVNVEYFPNIFIEAKKV